MIIKGVPSLFANIKALLEESPKRAAITDIVQGYLLSLRAVQKLEESDEGKRDVLVLVVYVCRELDFCSLHSSFRSRRLAVHHPLGALLSCTAQ